MKSERLVSLMLLLQARSPRSARELARTLEVSMRTVYRDVEALGVSGVPVYAERGSGGGIALSNGYRQAIAQFSTDELHALFAAAADPLEDLGVSAHERALHKIKGALPESQRRAADKAGERILVDHNRWFRSRQPAQILDVLRRAVWDDRALRITYRDRAGASTTREIEPLGLVSKAGVWYAAARNAEGELRTFRAERIEAIDELPRRFERPPGFNLHDYWRRSLEDADRGPCAYSVTLHVEFECLEMLLPYFSADVLSQDERGKTVCVQFHSQDDAVRHVMLLGARAHVIGPSEFRLAVAQRARDLLSELEPA